MFSGDKVLALHSIKWQNPKILVNLKTTHQENVKCGQVFVGLWTSLSDEVFQLERAGGGSVCDLCLLVSRGRIAGSRSSVGTPP